MIKVQFQSYGNSFPLLVLITVFLLASVLLFVQCKSSDTDPTPPTKSLKDLYKAQQLADNGDESAAIKKYEELLQSDPDNAEALMSLSMLYLDNKMWDKAKPTLSKLAKMPEVSDARVHASLGQIYFNEKEYEQALGQYQRFKKHKSVTPQTAEKTQDKIEQIEFIIDVLAKAYQINPIPLPKEINTPESEYLPQFTVDQENLIFTRRWFGQEDIFSAKFTDSTYIVSPIEALNTKLNEGAHTISADGRLLIFTHCNEKYGYGSCDLYRTELTKDGWARPANMGQRINSKNWESQPSLSADGNTLFYSTTLDRGIGGSDIWFTTRKEDGTWDLPTNIGKAINTPGNEESPFIHADGKTLYFRSNGHKGLGSFDIFMSRKVNGRWSAPIHLGSPLNSSENDGALVISLNGLKGFYASNFYNGQKKDDLDIYQFELPSDFRPQPMTYVKGRVTGTKDGYPLNANIKVIDLDNSTAIATSIGNYNGEFLIAVPVKSKLAINVEMEGFAFHSAHISFDDVRHGADPYFETIALQEIEPAEEKIEFSPIILSNLFFETGSAIILPASESEITLLYDLLNRHPKISIEITGHTDDVGVKIDNEILSQNRAISIKDRLIKMGISSIRIQTLGLGELMPIADNITPEGRAKNRRTEFIIIQ